MISRVPNDQPEFEASDMEEMGKPAKRNPYDKTSTKRSKALMERLKETGGAVVALRADGELLRQIDALVNDEGKKSRAELLASLVRERFSKTRPADSD